MSHSGGKRKRGAAEVKVKVAPNTDFIPIIATTPGVQIPQNTQLIAYSRPKATKRSKTNGVEYIVHGSSEKVDYEGMELEEDAQLEKYYVGIYDPKTGEVEVHPAPRVHVRREIKAYKERDAHLLDQNTVVDRFTSARAILGAEFGTKKSKKAIERRDLNQILIKEMDSAVTTSIVSQIGENTVSMPTREDLENEHEAGRLLPPHKTEGIISPSEVYNLDDIITKEEMEMLWVKDWYDAGNDGTAIYVPNNTHVSHRIMKLGLAKNQTAANTRRLKILKYISILRNLYAFFENRRDSERLLLQGKIMDIKKKVGCPEELCSILLKKFTEIVGGSSGPQDEKVDLKPRMKATPTTLTKLLNYIAILALMAEENFQVDVFYLKDDLGIQSTALLQTFGNVGCKRKDMPPIQADALGIPKAEVKNHRIAYLTAKPEFPKPRMRKKAAAKR